VKPLLLVPLDDRPCCLQFVTRLGEIAGLEIQVAPNDILGKFLEKGESDQILDWLENAIPTSRGAIVSLDMLCFGGLVASRSTSTDLAEPALARLKRFIDSLPEEYPVWASNSIMRTAPTQSTPEEVLQAQILVELSSRFADRMDDMFSGRNCSMDGAEQVRESLEYLTRQLPGDFLRNYLAARKRNQLLNVTALQGVLQRKFEHLLFGIDDSKTKGWNVLEIAALQRRLPPIGASIAPGTDENALLLFSRACRTAPRAFNLVVNEGILKQISAYEDRNLAELLACQMLTANLTTSRSESETPFTLFIHGHDGPQAEAENQAAKGSEVSPYFISTLQNSLAKGHRVVIADITYANGGCRNLARAIAPYMDELLGYCAWNTTGNTIGTALGLIGCASEKPSPQQRQAEKRFLWERILDDVVYQSQVRLDYRRQLGHLGLRLEQEQVEEIEPKLKDSLHAAGQDLGFKSIPEFKVHLPWNRLFEVEIDVTTKLLLT
jgi:hypothetical protein